MIKETKNVSKLELAEAAYWGKLYHPDQKLLAFCQSFGGGVACALPKVDILAFNRALGIPSSALTTELLEDITSFYQRAGVKRFFLQTDPAGDGILQKKMLEQQGFRYYNNWVKLSMPVEIMEQVPDKTGIEIRPVEPNEADTYGNLIITAFGWPESLAGFFAASIGLAGYQQFFACKHGKPIAAAALHMENEAASMAIAGTLPEYRGLGAQQALLHHRIRQAIRHGCTTIISETGDDTPDAQNQSLRNMKRTGFSVAYRRRNYIYEF